MKKSKRIWLAASLLVACVLVAFLTLSSRFVWASGNPIVAGSYRLYKTSGLTVVLAVKPVSEHAVAGDGVYLAARVDRIAVVENVIIGHIRSSPASVECKNQIPGFFAVDWTTDKLLGSGLSSLKEATNLASHYLGKKIDVSLKIVL